jgi:cytochrome c peroxidase
MWCARSWLGAAVVLAPLLADPGLALAQGGEPLRPLPPDSKADPARAALGKLLFFDPRLSGERRSSCATCHDLRRGGADGLKVAHPRGGKAGLFNTPSIYNSIFNFRTSWIGKPVTVDTLPEHVNAGSWAALLAALAGDGALAARFNDVYGAPLDAASARDALNHYLRTLVTPSRFDRYLRGDAAALSEEEKAGYARFKSYGCVACHQGVNVGGNMFARLGAMEALPGLAERPGGQGRFALTRRDSDRQVYRVPSLRNVALTAPYFHDGSVASLHEAVDLMFRHQLGRSAPQQDKDLIVRFLHTLNGERLPPPGAAP